MKLKLIFVIGAILALLSTGVQYAGDKVERYYPIVYSAIASGCMFLYFRLKPYLTWLLKTKNKIVPSTPDIKELMGIDGVVPREDHIAVIRDEKTTLHAFLKIIDVPYSIDDLDKEKKALVFANFSNLLKNVNFPWGMMLMIEPQSPSEYLNKLNKEIDDLRLRTESDYSSKNEAKIKRLQKLASRIMAGEGIRDVVFLCHVSVEGTGETARQKLEANANMLMSNLKTGINVEARRLKGMEMMKAFQFFRVDKPTKVFTFDLAWLCPLVKEKLPPLEKLLSGVYAGKTVSGQLVCLDFPRYANSSVVIVGRSGYGKSTTLSTLTTRMHDLWNTSTLFIDYTGEASAWVKSRGGKVVDGRTNGINPFVLGTFSVTDRTRSLLDMFEKVCELSPQGVNALSEYITRVYEDKGITQDPNTWQNVPPVLEDVIDLIDKDLLNLTSDLLAWKRVTLIALKQRLQPLAHGPMSIFKKSKFSVVELTEGFCSFDLSGIASESMKDALAYTLLQHVNESMSLQGISSSIRLVVVLDEAWRLCRDPDGLPVKIVKAGRKYGYSLIVSTQDATADLAEPILANAGTVIIHHTEHSKYLRFYKQSFGLTDQEIDRIRNLPVGEALIKIDDPRPFFVKIDAEDESRDSSSFSQSTDILPAASERPNIRADNSCGNISNDARKLLEAVSEEPENKVTYYYERLQFNPYQGNKAKNELMQQRLIESKDLPNITERGYNRVLSLSRQGRVLLQKEESTDRFGGIMHRYLIRRLAEKFDGHKVKTEYTIGQGKQVDLVIDGRIAIEVETSSRPFPRSNIEKNLARDFQKIIIICQTKPQASSYRDRLAEEFPNENRVLITDIASVLKMKKEDIL